MKVRLNRNENVHFTAVTESGHEIEIDGSAAIGGREKGARPMETVLAGLGGCSAIDVMSTLKKSRQLVTDCTIDIDAERADAIPAVFTRIHVQYTLVGNNLDPKKVDRAVTLSMEKYCSVTRMLEKTATISHGFKIVDA